MLEDFINRQWQALVHFLRGSRVLKLPENRTRKLSREKPSLIVAVGKRRKGNALEEYRRRFASLAEGSPPAAPSLAGDQGFPKQPAQTDRDRVKPPERGEKAKPGLRLKTRRSHRRNMRSSAEANRSGGSSQFLGAAWTLLRLALLRGYYGVAAIKPPRNALIGVTVACAITFGGAYVYRTLGTDSGDSFHASQAGQPLDEKPENADGRPGGNKRFYDRLTSDVPETATVSPALPPVRTALAEPQSGVPANREDEPVPEAAGTANAPAPSPPVAAERQAGGGPTVVRSERYLPDGTRTDIASPAPAPGTAKLDAGEARRALLAAAEPPVALAGGAAPQTNGAPAEGPAVQAAEPAPSSDIGYFAQVKSDQNEKAAEAELAAVMEKYKAVLGEVPLVTKSADLKEKGIWFRVLAGPVKSRDEAESLCKKLKSAGLQACIVQKLD